jgi:methionyl-tRNA formyltransferase
MGRIKEKILFCGYRSWALDIFEDIKSSVTEIEFDLARDKDGLNEKIEKYNYKVILFIGWSWIIKEEIINSKICVCLHPSLLPKYRGGCPLQHQIINGETTSAVTLFVMDKEIDHGPILWQKKFSLEGGLCGIFKRMEDLGHEGLEFILKEYSDKGGLSGEAQNHEEATFFKRRKPSESEIKIEDFSDYTAKELYNKVRALQDPYPNPYLLCKNGTKLFIKEANYNDERD